LGVAEIEFGAF